MSRTREEVQLELLKEINDVCTHEDIKYFVYGKAAVNIFKTGELGKDLKYLSVAMVQTDAEKLAELLRQQNNKDRYVEDLKSNERFNGRRIMYGDLNTIEFERKEWNIQDSDNRKHHCIHIDIFFIQKWLHKALSSRNKKTREIRQFLNMDFVGMSLWTLRLRRFFMRMRYGLRGTKKLGVEYDNDMKQLTPIESWNAIRENPYVTISYNKFPGELFDELQEIDMGVCKTYLPLRFTEYADALYDIDWREDDFTYAATHFYFTGGGIDSFKDKDLIEKYILQIRRGQEKVYKTDLKRQDEMKQIDEMNEIIRSICV